MTDDLNEPPEPRRQTGTGHYRDVLPHQAGGVMSDERFNAHAVPVAIAALVEAGRPDLASRVNPNRAGWPSMRHCDADHDVVVRAFWLGHLSSGHKCRIDTDEETGLPCIDCDDCLESYW